MALFLGFVMPCNAAFIEPVKKNVRETLKQIDAKGESQVGVPYFFEPKCHIEMRGYINEQALDKLEEIRQDPDIKKIEESGRPVILCLNGPGGDLVAALKIKPKIEKWITVVDKDAVCVSACAMVFMAGGRIFGDTRPERARFLHFDGRLGFHAPSLELAGDDVKISRGDVSNAYLLMQDTMRQILFPIQDSGASNKAGDRVARAIAARTQRNVSEALDRAFIPESLLFTFLFTPGSEMRYVETVEDAARWGIELFGYDRRPTDAHEYMLWNACFNMVNRRCGSGEFNCTNNGDFSIELAQARSTVPLLEIYRRRYGKIKYSEWKKSGTIDYRTAQIAKKDVGCQLQIFHDQRNGFTAIKGDALIEPEKDPVKSEKGPAKTESNQDKAEDGLSSAVAKAVLTDVWGPDSLLPPAGSLAVSRLALLPRVWTWLPPETRIANAALELDRLMVAVPEEEAQVRSGNYRALRLCNLTNEPVVAAFSFTDQNQKSNTEGWYHVNAWTCIARKIDPSVAEARYFALGETTGANYPRQIADAVATKGCIDVKARFIHPPAKDRIKGQSASCSGGTQQVQFEPLILHGAITSVVIGPKAEQMMELFQVLEQSSKLGSLLLGDLALAEPPRRPLPPIKPIDSKTAEAKPAEAKATAAKTTVPDLPAPSEKGSRPAICNPSDRPILIAIATPLVMSEVEKMQVNGGMHSRQRQASNATDESDIMINGWYRLDPKACTAIIGAFGIDDDYEVLVHVADEKGEPLTTSGGLLCVDRSAPFAWTDSVATGSLNIDTDTEIKNPEERKQQQRARTTECKDAHGSSASAMNFALFAVDAMQPPQPVPMSTPPTGTNVKFMAPAFVARIALPQAAVK